MSGGGEGFLFEAMLFGPSRAIENQEARGQAAVAAADKIPIDCRGVTDETLIAMGFTLGAPLDKLFRAATLPPGWRKVPTDHYLWTDLVDGDGVKRGAIGHKAAFYDQWAHMHLNRRFTAEVDGEKGACKAVVRDRGAVVFQGEAYGTYQDAMGDAESWLLLRFPCWENPAAYWTEAVEQKEGAK